MFNLSSVFVQLMDCDKVLVVIFLGSDVTPLVMSSSSLLYPCFNGDLGDGDVWLNVLAAQWGVLAP